MGSDHDIASRLPQAPVPSPEAREAAIAKALAQFDQPTQGAVRSRTRQGMPGVRQLLAASVVVGIAAPVAWHYLGSARQPEQFEMASGVVHQQESTRPKVIADRLESEVRAKRTAEAEPRSP